MSKRKPYRWGAKRFLADMNVGEVYTDDGRFSWRGLQSVASRLKREFGCEFRFVTFIKQGQRRIERIA